jgi:hypothetical protein
VSALGLHGSAEKSLNQSSRQIFPEFETRHAPMILSPEDAERKILRDLYNADVVIADMINDNPTTMYQLGVRYMTKRPIVHITSSDGRVTGMRLWRDWKSTKFIIANQDDCLPSSPEVQAAVQHEPSELYARG